MVGLWCYESFFFSDLQIESSVLTGESEPIAITSEPEPFVDNVLNSPNMAFNTTFVMTGDGYGVVVATGDDTMIGQVAQLASETTGEASTLQKEIIRVVHFITIFGSILYSSYYLFCFGNCQGK